MDLYTTLFEQARGAALSVGLMSDEERSRAICRVADAVDKAAEEILAANRLDLERMDRESPLYDRLQLTPERLAGITGDMRRVAGLECPTGELIESRRLENGLLIERVRVPFGVVGVIFEARPNVLFDVFGLCMKTGNVCVLKGGADARETNECGARVICAELERAGMDPGALTLLPSTHEAADRLLGARGWVDVCIPRGGRRLIDRVRDEARVPVIETGAGVVHTYVDGEVDLEMARRIVENGKLRRVSVCNALDTLLVSRERLVDLAWLVAPLAEKGVELYADAEAFGALAAGGYPTELLKEATAETWDTEWMSARMGVKVVADTLEAVDHIALHGSGHSEAIVSSSPESAALFRRLVDAACIYVNAPTSFTDGGEFGLGAEVGISTQKLGPRGPMGLQALTTYRWLITGEGQVRC